MPQENQQHQGVNMIDICIKVNQKIRCITAKGHAEYAPHGQDIVCSAVSTVLQGLGNYLKSTDKFYNIKILDVKYEPGDICVEFLNNSKNNKIDSVFDYVEETLKDLEATYPEHIKVSVEYD